MAPITLPASFYNSFWSPDYRTGLEVLFRQLESGCIENKDIANFVESQARAHHNLSAALLEPSAASNRNSTSSLQHTLQSLRVASNGRGEATRALAVELEEHVLVPFNGWRQRHEDRIEAAREALLSRGGIVSDWEKEVNRLMGLRQTYLVKTRSADDSEDDAKFAPATAAQGGSESYTQGPSPKHTGLRRAGTVADRISEKLRAASVQSSPQQARSATIDGGSPLRNNGTPSKPSPIAIAKAQATAPDLDSPSSPTQEDAFIPPTDPNGLPSMSADPNAPQVPGKTDQTQKKDVQEPPVLLRGLSIPARDFRALLSHFDQYLTTHAALGSALQGELSMRAVIASRQRSTILGTYEKTFSGIEVVEWLRKSVPGYEGEWDQCEEAAEELQRMGHLSRIGVGRGFEASDDTFYTLKINPAEGTALATLQKSVKDMNISSPNTAHYTSLIKNYLPTSLAQTDEPAYIRLRREATKANESYRHGIDEAEAKRLDMEESIERGLRIWERWERERLGVVNTVLKHYEQIMGKLPKRLENVQESTQLSVEAFNPEADLKALIEGNRTGTFRPRPHVYESIESEAPEVNFGIDLRRWSGEHAWKAQVEGQSRPKDAIPEVLSALQQALKEKSSEDQPAERRKAWIYEVPLTETHELRKLINSAQLTTEDMTTIGKRFNAPIIAGAIKLWLLELNPPVLGWEGWEDAKAIYPSVGADQERDMTSAVTSVLARLPGAQLFTLNAIVKEWKDLIASTRTEDEPDKAYITKLALSVGRCILRPQYETELTIQDRTPGLFVADLIEHYDGVFPALVEKKKMEADRPMPTRKRTALVDQRMSRSNMSIDADPQAILAQQRSLQQPSRPTEPAASPAPAPAPTVAPTAPVIPAPSFQSERIHVLPATPVNVIPASPNPRQNAADSDEDEPPFDPTAFQTPSQTPPMDNSRPILPPVNMGGSISPGRASPASPGGSSAHVHRQSLGEDAITPGGAGLKRNSSAEASRLRGPRGARGPRPNAPPAQGHNSRGSVSQIAAQFETK